MKALSLIQPYASLIVVGAKRIETRCWHTAYRGPIAIHASSRCPAVFRALVHEQPFAQYLPANLPTGAILGFARLTDCIQFGPAYRVAEPERSFGDFYPGRYGWLLEAPYLLPAPIPVKGHLGVWTWTPPPDLQLPFEYISEAE